MYNLDVGGYIFAKRLGFFCCFFKKQHPLFTLTGKSGYFYLFIYLLFFSRKLQNTWKIYILKSTLLWREKLATDTQLSTSMLFVVKLDSMWGLTSFWSRWPFKELQFCTFFFFFFCFRRQRILLAKEKSRNVEKVEQSVNIVYFCITLCHYLATFETIQWKQRGRWIELLLKRYDKLDDDDILLFVCVLFSFVFSCWVSRTGKVSDGLRPSVWGSYFSRGYVWPFSA